MKKSETKLAFCLSLCFLMVLSTVAFAANAPKNIIILISDGCGYYHVDAASIYEYGQTGMQVYEKWPVKVGMATYSAGNLDADGNWTYKGSYDPDKAWTWFEYFKEGYTDSASAATAMSTGVKTYDSAIGVDVNGNPVKHIGERAEELGKATGVVSSVEFSHATPAGFVAHNVNRNNYAEIAQEMILDSKTEVIMGCGNPDYDNDGKPSTESSDKYIGGSALWQQVQLGATEFDLDGDGVVDNVVEDVDGDGNPDPWTVVQDLSEFHKYMNGPTPKRLLGVPKVYQTLQYNRSSSAVDAGGDYAGAAGEPYADPFIPGIPTLAEMTTVALNVLDNDPDGLLLMVEAGAVDWASHGNSSGRVIEEEIDFNRTVDAVIDWVNTNSSWDETLVIVTGDHECGYLTGTDSGPDPDDPDDDVPPVWNDIVNNGAGNLPGMEWHSGSHTNQLIPFYAKGAGADLLLRKADEMDPVRGAYIDNTEIAKTAFELMAMPGENYGNVFFMELNAGLNMVSLPLKPVTPFNAATFAEELGASVVIKLEEEAGKFIGFVPDAGTPAFPIEGGKGYIVNVEESKMVPFVGAAWTNTPPVMAPGLKANSAWAFVVTGTADITAEGYIVEVKNVRTGKVISDSVASSGIFTVATADLNRGSVVEANDKLEIVIKDASGSVVSEYTSVINPVDIRKAHLNIPLKLDSMVPNNYALFQNYPNPFNPETWIPYQLPEASDVTIRIFNDNGKLVRTLKMGEQPAGTYMTKGKSAFWNGLNDAGETVGSGVYFYQLQADEFSTVKKMIVQK
ncbi:T9SS type A sorting domain-containing protein [Candidatus Poribacteria bacterium]|nr:T9SS type A sorting domain-containing protein [Candidatus Poribacteria bacterium]